MTEPDYSDLPSKSKSLTQHPMMDLVQTIYVQVRFLVIEMGVCTFLNDPTGLFWRYFALPSLNSPPMDSKLAARVHLRTFIDWATSFKRHRWAILIVRFFAPPRTPNPSKRYDLLHQRSYTTLLHSLEIESSVEIEIEISSIRRRIDHFRRHSPISPPMDFKLTACDHLWIFYQCVPSIKRWD